MKRPLRILLTAICAALILALPFLISAPDRKAENRSGTGLGQEEIDFGAAGVPEEEKSDH